jgi:tRNA G37 N-methylase TrmD
MSATPPNPTGIEPALVVDVLTLFPGLFDGFLGESIVKRAIEHGLIRVRT